MKTQFAGRSRSPTGCIWILFLSTLALPAHSAVSSISASRLLDYWRQHETAPLDYIASKFEEKRWVFIGEYHRIRHDVALIVELVPRLHESTSVRHLALEFLCRDHTAEANRLINAANYDRDDVIDFFRAQFPDWSYEEYVQIFESAWASNQKFAAERGAFRLVGLHPCVDWETIHYSTDSEAVAAERDKLRRYDEIMAQELIDHVLRPGYPAVIFTGIAHATGKFAEYRVGTDSQLIRMGNLVNRAPYSKDMFFVALHAPFYDSAGNRDIYPFDGILDELMLAFGRDIGFDVTGSPFEDIVHEQQSKHSITAYAFGELYDGYVIFETAIKEYVGATCIDDWVTDREELLQFAHGLGNKEASEKFSAMTVEQFRADQCAPRPDHGVEFQRRFRNLPDLDGGSMAGRTVPVRMR